MSASIIRYGLCSGLLYVCMVSPVLAYLGAGLKTPGLANPHREAADCSVCHVAPEDKLKSWYTLPSTKRKLVSGANEVCLKCHTPGMGHGVGKRPDMNVNGLPLDDDGAITCATTCHNMHIRPTENVLQNRFMLRAVDPQLCLMCHTR